MALRALAVLIALAGVVTAVGPDDAGGASAPAYRARADAVCAQANARLAALPSPRTSAAVRIWVNRAVPIVSRSVRRARALTPPGRLRARHRSWSAALGARVRVARALRRDIRAGAPPIATLEAARPRLARLKRRARVRARALGLRACAGRHAGRRP